MLLITVIIVKGTRVSIVKAKGRPRGHNEATSLPQREIHERKEDTRLSRPSYSRVG